MDYKKVLERLKKQSKGSGDRNYMDLEEGKNVARFLPGHPNMEGFFEEVFYHSKKDPKSGKRMQVICLNHGDPRADVCLICPELEPLQKSKDKKDKKLYNEQKAKSRFFANVIDRTDQALKILGMGITILKGVLGYVTDEDYGDVLHPLTGRDMVIEKTGDGMDTEYDVKCKPKESPIFPDKAEIVKLIGKSAEDTQLNDLTELKAQFEGEAEKALKVWNEGWESLKEDDEDSDDSVENIKKKAKELGFDKGEAPAKKGKAAPVEDEAEAEEEPAIDFTNATPLKSRCSVCGDKRFKTSSGNVCKNGHGGVPALAEGERPSKPSKAYLAEFPDPEPEEQEEAEEPEVEEAPKRPTAAASGGAKKQSAPANDDDGGLDDLDAILNAHSSKGKK